MKLSQIYTNNKFKKIKFNPKLNVILGKVTKPKDSNTDSHNLGKSTLIDVIDFLMLKEIDNSHFLIKYKKFLKYEFFLEIKLNTGEYLTIKRIIAKPTKIFFKLHQKQYQDFTFLTEWDHEDVAIKKAQKLLNSFLAFDVLSEVSYRNIISYFLRTQSDYFDIFQLHKFNRSLDSDWKPSIFTLLGFNGALIEKKYEKEKELEEQGELIKKLSQQLSISVEETDKIQGLIQLKDDEKNQVEKQLDNFDFYEKEKLINTELIEDIEKEISKLNSVEYNIDYEISQIKESLENRVNFDIDDTRKIFDEVKIYFPDQLINSYKNLVKFNKEVSEERNKYLNERLNKLTTDKEKTTKKLIEQNDKRVSFLSFIKDVDSFKKFKNYQKNLIKIETEILTLKNQLETVKSISLISDKKSSFEKELEVLEKQVEAQINEGNELYSSIRRSFTKIIKDVINKPALISIRINKNKNVDFQADLQSPDEVNITAGGRGTSYRKLLCVAFDLSLLINYADNSFFKFVYHDGVLEALDDRKKIKFINLVREISNKDSIQYILTAIEHDLPRDDNGEIVKFEKDEIILELTDEGDEGRLFEQSF